VEREGGEKEKRKRCGEGILQKEKGSTHVLFSFPEEKVGEKGKEGQCSSQTRERRKVIE